MVYITGDTHGDFTRVAAFCERNNTTIEDVFIILGDAGINYYLDHRDKRLKKELSELPITLFCIHGNHEERPQNLPSYISREFSGGTVWYEEQYPNILFAKDGEIFRLGGLNCLVIGGAYSVDKHYRLYMGWHWFSDEQPTSDIKAYVETQLENCSHKIDIVLSHTCPLNYEPTEVFLPGIDQRTVDKSTELWLDKIEQHTTYSKWYCGHFHTDKSIDKLRFMSADIEVFGAAYSSGQI